MKVRDLIHLLQSQDPSDDVVFDDGCSDHVTGIKLHSVGPDHIKLTPNGDRYNLDVGRPLEEA